MTADIQFVYLRREGINYRVSAAYIERIAENQGEPRFVHNPKVATWGASRSGDRIWWYDYDARQIYGFEWISEINAWVEYFEADRRKDAEYYWEITDQYKKERQDIQMRATEQLERAAREYDRKRREISWDRRQYYRQLNDDNYLEGRPNIWDEKEKKMREERGL
jgi:hypothetical protein